MKIFTVNFCDRKQLVVREQFASQDSLLVPVRLHYFQSKKPLIWKCVKETVVCMVIISTKTFGMQ